MEEGIRLPKGGCYWQRLKPAEEQECEYPPPETTGIGTFAWRLFQRTFSCTIFVGMDGWPIGRDPVAVAKIAETMDIGWDENLMNAYQVIEAEWLAEQHRIRKKEPPSKGG